MQSYSIIVWIIQIYLSGLINTHRSCLTWEKKQNYMWFLCRVTDDSKPVILIDPDGDTYEEHIVSNQLYNIMTQGSHVFLFNIHDAIFTINTQNTNVDGIWMCCQGEESLQTEVSVTAGIISATSIQVVGTLITNYHSSKVKLACFSCREPYGNNVEFLINEQSEDTITFNKDTGSCIHITGNCLPHECVCSSSGNEFIRIFPIDSYEQSTLYSCSMQFKDRDKGSIFLKLTSIYFNGTDFSNMTTTTTIIKAPDVNEVQTQSDITGNYPAVFQDVNDTIDEDSKYLVIEVIIICIFASVCIIVVNHISMSTKYEKNHIHEKTMTGMYKYPTTSTLYFGKIGDNIYVDAQTMTIEKRKYTNAETMTDENVFGVAHTTTNEADEHPVIQAQTASIRPNSFNIELKIPGIVVFEILKMKREIVFTGIKEYNKKRHQLFVVNIHNLDTQCFDLEKKPYNITSFDDDIVALSYPDKKEVDMINIKTGRMDQSIKFKSLAIFQSDNQFFVINFGKIDRITTDGFPIESFNLPTYMIDHISVYDKRLYYTCNESLYCCGLDGTLIWMFKSKIAKRLSGVTTDRYGDIYVSSADPVNILVISHEGQFLKNIGYHFRSETKPVKLHFDKQDNCLAILRHSNNVIDFFYFDEENKSF